MGRGELRSLDTLFVIDPMLSGTLQKVRKICSIQSAEDCGALDS